MSKTLQKTESVVKRLEDDRVMVIENVAKKFCKNLKRSMWYGSKELALNVLGVRPKTDHLRRDEFWALNDINLELRRGDILGIIGMNGCGKTTLLSLMAGIFPPDQGEIGIRGRIGSLIALGAGFHPHMTGRENVYLNGIILGMSRAEVDKKFQSIADFADIGDFLDAPVSTYSSGMTVRLGFAVAIHCEPEILLIDEVLAVGDVSFRNKCLRKMSELRRRAKAMIFVSHQMTNVRAICNRVIVMDKGKIVHDGGVEEGIARYQSIARDVGLIGAEKERDNESPGELVSTEIVEYIDSGVLDEQGNETQKIAYGEDIRIYYDIRAHRDIPKPMISFGLWDPRDVHILSESNLYEDNGAVEVPAFEKGRKYRLSCVFKKPNILPGIYRLNLGVEDAETYERYHLRIQDPVQIEHRGLKNFIIDGVQPPVAVMDLESTWDFTEMD